MSLDPQVADLLPTLDAGFPPVHTMTGPEVRAAISARLLMPASPEPVAAVSNRTISGPGGDLAIRIYRPLTLEKDTVPAPLMVFAHGGGFVFCNLDSHDGLCRAMANGSGVVVVAVDYRLAPEHRWPAAAEDVYAVTEWVGEHAAELGADPARLLVGGDSAGGNLAAVAALMARDRGGPTLAGQLLLYPVIAADFNTESYRLFGEGYYNPATALRWYWDQYVPKTGDRDDPYACPLRADLQGLPPAVIVLTGHDPLRDEAIAYADALESAGVPTVRLPYEGGIHGFMTMPMLELAQRARADVNHAVAQLMSASSAR